MSDPFELGKRLTDPNGNVFQRPPHRNTRKQNAAVGATVVGGLLGGSAAVLGAVAGKNRARSGVRLLHSVGAGPTRAGTARVVAGHTAREAGKAGAVLGGVGAAYGALVGVSAAHRKDHKKLPVGRVRKNDRHMDPAPATARLAGALPKHTAGAQAVAQAAATKRKPPVAAAIRGTLRATTIAKAEDPFQPMAKSAFGERGDKRNTKYAAAGYAGGTVGSVAGRRLGVRSAGTSMQGIYAHAAAHHEAAAEMGIPPERGVMRSGLKALKGAHGARAMLVGDLVGSTAGAAAGAAAVHRRRVRRGVAKSAFGVEHPDSVEKSALGAPGDKRNTKYAAAGYGGALVGMQAGGRLGARAGGTTLRAVTTANRGHLSGPRVSDAEHLRRVGSIPGARPTVAGLAAGAALGGAAAAGAVHRHRSQNGVAKSAFEPVAKKKIPAVLPGEKVAPRGFEPKKLPARSVRDSSGRGAQGQRRAVRSGKV